jgi:AraC family transcriptional regulator
LKQVLPFGKFYGESRKQIKTSTFEFAEVEDFVNREVPFHTHENAHFLFIIKGEYEANLQDKKRFCSPSTTLYYPAETAHRDHFYNLGERRFMTVSLTCEANKELLEEIKLTDYSKDLNDLEVSLAGKRIRKELRAPDNLSPFVLEGIASELLVYAARSLDKSNKLPIWLKAAREVLNDRCHEDIKMSDIAKEIGVHQLHLARTFRRFFRCSPGEYLRECRIELASNLLLKSKKTLVEIALMSGFPDQSNFTRAFRQNTGVTPAQFRRYHNL